MVRGSNSCYRNWMVIYAVTLHLAWAGILLRSAEPLKTTPMGHFPFESQHAAAIWYAFVAAMAISTHWASRSLTKLALLLPQQAALMLSAFTALECVLRGQYFDGVPRPTAFILADQLPSLLAMLLHTAAIVDWSMLAGRRGPS